MFVFAAVAWVALGAAVLQLVKKISGRQATQRRTHASG
jgi:hypothetical protein